jgi:hypothetical protein
VLSIIAKRRTLITPLETSSGMCEAMLLLPLDE